MKTNFPPLFLLLATTTLLCGAPLAETTAVHTRPDAAAPIIRYLNAGSEPVPATGYAAFAKAGWVAIEVPGPFDGYVQNKDLAKNLDVKPGASVHLAPKPEAGVLAVLTKDDKTTLTGIHGKWTQISLNKKLTGYISAPVLGSAQSRALDAIKGSSGPVAFTPAPVVTTAYGSTAPGHAAPMVNLGDAGARSLPRQFAGKFVSTRRALTPRRPYDWALNDDAGKRFAYLDVSKLLLTEQIEKYLDHAVVVYGAAMNAPGGKEIVIEVDSLLLR